MHIALFMYLLRSSSMQTDLGLGGDISSISGYFIPHMVDMHSASFGILNICLCVCQALVALSNLPISREELGPSA